MCQLTEGERGKLEDSCMRADVPFRSMRLRARTQRAMLNDNALGLYGGCQYLRSRQSQALNGDSPPVDPDVKST